MLGSELRRKYLEFFESKGALRLPSDSLVPDDPTLLFTSAGMVQFKPYFLGLRSAPRNSVATSQKCLRTTDIEEVGDTSHCTFFEMLGNFSFGDYFQPQAIAWAWEFLTEVLKLDIERLRFSIYLDDERAFELWKEVGVPERKIFRMDEAHNYWPASVITKGPNGPCGPCSEIFFDTRPDLPPTPDGVWDDDRWLEIWNLVFTQFDRGEGGVLTPLPKKNIDTGMGLERTAAAIANLRGPFETDLFRPIIARLEEISGLKYTSSDTRKEDIAFRRIADHARAATFCLGDGVLPSNVGRGYVLRRIMRRAVLAGRSTLGLSQPFLHEVVPTIIAQRSGDYPELAQQSELILRHTTIEEKQFRRTLESGYARLTNLLESNRGELSKTLSGADAFTLFTTYGFPVELTTEVAAEHGLTVDLIEFDRLLVDHARVSEGNSKREVFIESVVPELRSREIAPTGFVGYQQLISSGTIKAIIKDGKLVDRADEGDYVQIVTDQTPFYAESGGQMGDSGNATTENGAFVITDTHKDSSYWFHIGSVTSGEINVGDILDLKVDAARRADIQRNHTSTHLLHKALQQVLGSHVQQRGSLVAPDRLRFDFAHDKSMSAQEVRRVEDIVNERILDDIEIRTAETPIEEARKMGAMMLFGEKYGDIVRVVTAGDFSVEFCGGTHLRSTAQAGLFKIVSESSSQAGVRRIEAVTGRAALRRVTENEESLSELTATLKTTPANLHHSVAKLVTQVHDLNKELQSFQKAAAGGQVEKLASEAAVINGVTVVIHVLPGNTDAEALKVLADELLNRLHTGVVVLGSSYEGKASIAVKVSDDLLSRGLHAGKIVGQAAKEVGGGGGGRPNFAQAGGRNPEKLSDALAVANTLISEALVA